MAFPPCKKQCLHNHINTVISSSMIGIVLTCQAPITRWCSITSNNNVNLHYTTAKTSGLSFCNFMHFLYLGNKVGKTHTSQISGCIYIQHINFTSAFNGHCLRMKLYEDNAAYLACQYFQADSGNSSNINQKAQGKCLLHSILISITMNRNKEKISSRK